MELLVDIRKKLAGFQLDVKLSGGSEATGLLGASGSGKSMTLRCIAGIVRPDEGRIVVNGRTFFDSKKGIDLKPRERNVGLLFQNYALFPHLTVRENIEFGISDKPKVERGEVVAELIERFQLKGLAERYPSQVSGGQQQRIALARVIAAQPDIILLDEPFSALDVHLRAQMIDEMRERLQEFGKSSILVTHNIEEAFAMCDNLAVLSRGMVHAFDEKNKVMERPMTLEALKITGCENIAPVRAISDGYVEIPQWNLRLKANAGECCGEGHVGIRAGHIMLHEASNDNETGCNVVKAWIAGFSETPFRVRAHLKFSKDSSNHLAWDVGRETWEKVRLGQQPIVVRIPAEKVMFVETLSDDV